MAALGLRLQQKRQRRHAHLRSADSGLCCQRPRWTSFSSGLCFYRREVSSIPEPWYTPPATAPDAKAFTATPKAVTDAAKVAELRERLLRKRVSSGTATVEESIAYNSASGLKRKHEEDKGKAKKDDDAGDEEDEEDELE